MFGVLKTPRRIILSGTPIQNDLSEFHAMVNNITSGSTLFDVGFDRCLGRLLQPGSSRSDLISDSIILLTAYR